MMLSWMLSALMFGACVALAAAAAEPILRALGRPLRWTWAGALLVGSLWPAIAALVAGMLPLEAATVLPEVGVVPRGSSLLVQSLPRPIDAVHDVVLALWALASLVLLVRLARSMIAVRRLRDRAEPRLIGGVRVLVTDASGPAAVGLRRQAVLLPRDLLDVDESLQRLVVLHEREHCEARDPWFLFGAAAAVTLFPWNPALWLIARRLHLALEIDCDARVLATGVDLRRYSRLLLLVAQRPRALALASTFAASSTNLERRIDAMHTHLARPRSLQLVAASMLLVLGVMGACSEGTPNAPQRRESSVAPATAAQPTTVAQPATAAQPAQTEFLEFQVQREAKQIPGTGLLRYPPAMRTANREGEVLVQFVVDERGNVDLTTFKVLKSTDPAFTAAVRAALPTMRFTPANVKGRVVKQLVQQPFTFALGRS